MKMLEWWARLDELAHRHGKHVFTVTELAHLGGTSRRAVNVELSRLMRHGILARYAQGRYGLPGRATAAMLLPHLDPSAYISGSAALFRHGIITQEPVKITCMTSRRHGRRRERATAAGIFIFVCVRKPVYAPPSRGLHAPPEQALCDFIFLARRAGNTPGSLVTFRNLDRLRASVLGRIAGRYPATVAREVFDLAGLPVRGRRAGGRRSA
ncbi:MAG: hypothetical protein PHN82_09580 [bacterium]|nr:hypothetical protein [bacterium]